MNARQAKTYGSVAAVLVLIGLGVAAWMRGPDPATAAVSAAAATPGQAIDPMLDARSKGPADAPITIFELSDFQCPYCRMFYDSTMAALDEEYLQTGKARLTFINLPLAQIHRNAPRAHEFAMCAALQDRFWLAHDRLFETQPEWQDQTDPDPHFRGLGTEIGLDSTALDRCLLDRATRPVVAADVQLAVRNQLTGTPTFIVEGAMLQGAINIETFRTILDSIHTVKTGR